MFNIKCRKFNKIFNKYCKIKNFLNKCWLLKIIFNRTPAYDKSENIVYVYLFFTNVKQRTIECHLTLTPLDHYSTYEMKQNSFLYTLINLIEIDFHLVDCMTMTSCNKSKLIFVDLYSRDITLQRII
jgi:hypothetical protein